MLKKVKAVFKLVIIPVLICIVTSSCGGDTKGGFDLQKESEYCKFYCMQELAADIDKLADTLDGSYRVFSRHLNTKMSDKISVTIYPDIKSFREVVAKKEGIKESEIPDWVCTYSTAEGIDMISPDNKEYTRNPANITLGASSELCRVLIYNISKKAPNYLVEFIPRYETDLYYGVMEDVVQRMNDGTFPTIDMVLEPDAEYYTLSHFTFVEYLIESYGYDGIKELIKNSDIEKYLEKSKEELEKEWYEYVRLAYIETGLENTIESEHFIIEYDDGDSDVAESAEEILESNYDRITSNLGVVSSEKYRVAVYPTMERFNDVRLHEGIYSARAGAMNGYYNPNRKILNVYSYNDNMGWNIQNDFGNLLLHEFTHAVTHEISSQIYVFLGEGTAHYMSREADASFLITVNPALRDGTFPTTEQLKNITDALENPEVYQFGKAVVEYVVENYGYPYLTEYIKNQDDIQKVFGITEEEFNEDCVRFLTEKYIE
ncbi:MAG: hypothetical protein J1F64_10335 [Oscillospiraceae bacterium]|nr:hypothetical protein [Oscillospiraceae bacterium]